MRIALFVEGRTETACKTVLKALLDEVAQAETRPCVGLSTHQYRGTRIWDSGRVAWDAEAYLRQPDVCGAVLLLDVHPRFDSATAAVAHYHASLGHKRFRVHCALHDFETWLLPHWERLHQLARRTPPKRYPWRPPEEVNRVKPPSRVLSELFAPHRGYEKALDAPRILQSPDDLRHSAEKWPQLKLFLNTLLEFAGYATRI